MSKNITPYLFGIAAAGLTIMVAGTASYLLMPPGTYEKPELNVSPQLAQELATAVLQEKCADCHGDNPTYNSFVNFFALGMLKDDVDKAQKAFTITPDPAVRSANVDYAKMDYVLRTRRMPPTRYTAVHLGSRLTPDDVALLRTRYTRNGALLRMFAPIEKGMDSDKVTPMENLELDIIWDEDPSDPTLLMKVQLGHLLFFDTRLSTTDTVSCATCHDLTKGGTDNKPKSEGVPGPDGKPQLGGVNAPSVYNAAGNIRQFWDGRAADLKEQAGGPPLNPVEMGYAGPEDWAKIADKLAKDPDMVALFQKVYGDKGITGETITDAIATFERYLTTPGSAFDEYMRGKADALTDAQKDGLEAFAAYGCATCHLGPTMGGLSFENINTHAPLRAHVEGYTECAYGHKDFTGQDKHYDMFRVPNLRNVALTAPYFHTGTVDKLEDAVRIMFQTQVGTEPSKTTVQNVTEFLKAQTGKLGGTPIDRLTPEEVAPTLRPKQANTAQHTVSIEDTDAEPEPTPAPQPEVVEPEPAPAPQPEVVELQPTPAPQPEEVKSVPAVRIIPAQPAEPTPEAPAADKAPEAEPVEGGAEPIQAGETGNGIIIRRLHGRLP